MVSSVLTFFGVLAALLIINLQLGLAVLCILPALVVATVVFRAKSARAYADSREKVAVVNADFAENVAGLRVTQAFRRERGQPGPVRPPQRGVPGLAAARAAEHRALLPVRADPVHRGRGDRAGHRDR